MIFSDPHPSSMNSFHLEAHLCLFMKFCHTHYGVTQILKSENRITLINDNLMINPRLPCSMWDNVMMCSEMKYSQKLLRTKMKSPLKCSKQDLPKIIEELEYSQNNSIQQWCQWQSQYSQNRPVKMISVLKFSKKIPLSKFISVLKYFWKSVCPKII